MQSNYVACNQALMHAFKVRKINLIGRSDYDMSWETFADLFRQRDKEAITINQLSSFDPVPISKSIILTVQSIKSPIQDKKGETIGIFGQVNLLTMNNSLEKVLAAIRVLDQKNNTLFHGNNIQHSYKISHYPASLKLTSRETECLFLLVSGKSAKEMAKFLEISPRTVEYYIENIKSKLCVSSRSEIIEKAVEKGLLDIIPQQEILAGLSKNKDKWCDFLYGGI